MRRWLPVLVALALAGCGASAHSSTGSTVAVDGPSDATVEAAPALAQPPCSTAITPGHRLSVRTTYVPTSGSPFGVVTTDDGRYSFVSTDQVSPTSAAGGIIVLTDHGLRPMIVHTVATPDVPTVGLSLSHDGRYLLAASNTGATVFDVAALERGAPGAVLGRLSTSAGGGGIEVTVSPDDRYAFVSLEDAQRIAVFDLAAALADHFRSSGYVGSIPTELAPVGTAISPDGRWLYATSELAGPTADGAGTLSVIDLRRAETDPARSVVRTVDAGCGPVRVAVSPDGSVVWVTARESDRLLGFSATRLRTEPARALIADVEVGEAPVGLALVGDRIVVADSNRFGARGRQAMLTIVDAARALAHRPAVVGTVPSGQFPREMSLEPDGTLLVTNYGSDRLEAVDLR